MHRLGWGAVAIVAGLAVSMPTTAGSVTPEATIAVSPNTGVVDHQVVTVTGDGFEPGEQFAIVMCRAAASHDECSGLDETDGLDVADAEADGSFSHPFGVSAVIHDDTGAFDCRTGAGGCEVRIGRFTGETLATPITFDPVAPLAPPPTVTVAPNTGLVDGTTVDVAASGFRPGAALYTTLCPGTVPVLEDCENGLVSTFFAAPADLTGALDQPLLLRTVIVNHGGPTATTEFDCRTMACSILVHEYDLGFSRGSASALVSFDPSAPLAPPPEMTVTPSAELVDGQAVAIDGSGFLPGDTVYINQCVTGLFDDGGPYGGLIECSGGPAPPELILTVADDGTISDSLEVVRGLEPFHENPQVTDCGATPCSIVAFAAGDRGDASADAPISFAAVVPRAVSPQFTG